MTTELPITKYNSTRAKWYFALFKFLELFGVFLFTFGFYGLGSLVYKHIPRWYNFLCANNTTGVISTGYFYSWGVGFFTFLVIVLALIATSGTLYGIYLIIKAWIKSNWNLAKRVTEDKTAKAKRLKQQEIEDKKGELEQKKKDRKKYGYCVGDEAKYINKNKINLNNGKESNWRRFGQKCKILEIDKVGDIYPEWEDGTEGSCNATKFILSSSFKITKKQPLK